MGRVKRYKKLKSCDPFAKKQRVVVDPKYNQPPSDSEDDFEGDGNADEEFAFVARDRRAATAAVPPGSRGGGSMMPAAAAALWEARNGGGGAEEGSSSGGPGAAGESKAAKKRARKRAREEKGATESERAALSAQDAMFAAQSELQRVLREAKEVSKVSTEVTAEEMGRRKRRAAAEQDISTRREGESLRAYKRRVREETRQLVTAEVAGRSSTAKKKKEFLEGRRVEEKLKKKFGADHRRRLRESQVPDDEKFAEERSDGGLTAGGRGQQHARKVTVGLPERPEAPPSFDALPRGAVDRKAKQHQHQHQGVWSRGTKMGALLQQAEDERRTRNNAKKKKAGGGGGGGGDGLKMTPSRKLEVEQARRAAADGYRELKEKRRRAAPEEGETL